MVQNFNGEFAFRSPDSAEPLRTERRRGMRGEIIHWIRTGETIIWKTLQDQDPSLNNGPRWSKRSRNIHCRLPCDHKSFNLLSGTIGKTMFKILQKTISTGIVTTTYPWEPAKIVDEFGGARASIREVADERPADGSVSHRSDFL